MLKSMTNIFVSLPHETFTNSKININPKVQFSVLFIQISAQWGVQSECLPHCSQIYGFTTGLRGWLALYLK
jgi:hypothetical protein